MRLKSGKALYVMCTDEARAIYDAYAKEHELSLKELVTAALDEMVRPDYVPEGLSLRMRLLESTSAGHERRIRELERKTAAMATLMEQVFGPDWKSLIRQEAVTDKPAG